MLQKFTLIRRGVSREILVMVAASVGVALFRYAWLTVYIGRIPPRPYDFVDFIFRVPTLLFVVTSALCIVIVIFVARWATKRSRS